MGGVDWKEQRKGIRRGVQEVLGKKTQPGMLELDRRKVCLGAGAKMRPGWKDHIAHAGDDAVFQEVP